VDGGWHSVVDEQGRRGVFVSDHVACGMLMEADPDPAVPRVRRDMPSSGFVEVTLGMWVPVCPDHAAGNCVSVIPAEEL